jgi:hypothetical protein
MARPSIVAPIQVNVILVVAHPLTSIMTNPSSMGIVDMTSPSSMGSVEIDLIKYHYMFNLFNKIGTN